MNSDDDDTSFLALMVSAREYEYFASSVAGATTGTISLSSSQLAPRDIHSVHSSDHGNNHDRCNHSPPDGMQDLEDDEDVEEDEDLESLDRKPSKRLRPSDESYRSKKGMGSLPPRHLLRCVGGGMTSNQEKNHDVARSHEHGVSTLVPLAASGNPTTLVEHIDGNTNSVTSATDMATDMAKTNSVYFGWIRHPATKAWRDAVKRFSQNRIDFRSWTDDICQSVRDGLKHEKGIEGFFICRRPTGGSKKIFEKGESKGDCVMGEWSPATGQEILDRTKQRFIDDRKPSAEPKRVKRPRGRPPKDVSDEDDKNLIQIQSALQSLEASHNKGLLGAGDAGSLDESNNLINSSRGASVPPPMLLMVMREFCSMHQRLDRMQQLFDNQRGRQQQPLDNLRGRMQQLTPNQMNVVLSKAGDAIMASGADSTDSEDHETAASLCEQGSSKKSKIVFTVPIRFPRFHVLSEHDVCLGCIHHPGTVKWVDVVNGFASDPGQFPNWEDTMVCLVIAGLEESGCSAVLVALDSQHMPVESIDSIDNTQWYDATKSELSEWTKRQFLACRKARLSASLERAF